MKAGKREIRIWPVPGSFEDREEKDGWEAALTDAVTRHPGPICDAVVRSLCPCIITRAKVLVKHGRVYVLLWMDDHLHEFWVDQNTIH